MPKIAYTNKKFSKTHQEVIATANRILREYQAQGYDLTLRGLYYKFVGQDLFPENRRFSRRGSKWVKDENGTMNAEPNYKWLGGIINDARMAGLIDWYHIRDRTRSVKTLTQFDDAADAISSVVGWYHIDFWENQSVRPEVWVEKDAQIGNMLGMCQKYDVPLFSCRGYTSQSAMWAASQRLKRQKDNGQEVVVLHFGDHDPSGIDMSRDIDERLDTFMGGVDFRRLALNMDQVQDQQLPPDPAKLSDSRCDAYIKEHGDESWEMDALEPSFINEQIEDAILGLRDDKQWLADEARCEKSKDELRRISGNYDDVLEYLNDMGL
jgi:hypothetical protein